MIATFPALIAAPDNHPITKPELPFFQRAAEVPIKQRDNVIRILSSIAARFPLFKLKASVRGNGPAMPWLVTPVMRDLCEPIEIHDFSDDGQDFWAVTPYKEGIALHRIFFQNDDELFFSLTLSPHWIAPWAASQVCYCLKSLTRKNCVLRTYEGRLFFVEDYFWRRTKQGFKLMALSIKDLEGQHHEVAVSTLFYPSGQSLLGHLLEDTEVAPWSIRPMEELPDGLQMRGSEICEIERKPVVIRPGGFLSRYFAIRCPGSQEVTT